MTVASKFLHSEGLKAHSRWAVSVFVLVLALFVSDQVPVQGFSISPATVAIWTLGIPGSLVCLRDFLHGYLHFPSFVSLVLEWNLSGLTLVLVPAVWVSYFPVVEFGPLGAFGPCVQGLGPWMTPTHFCC